MIGYFARVVKWQTRKHEGLVPQGLGVQLPPRALNFKVIILPVEFSYIFNYRDLPFELRDASVVLRDVVSVALD